VILQDIGVSEVMEIYWSMEGRICARGWNESGYCSEWLQLGSGDRGLHSHKAYTANG
jgi:hypothetical protein